MHIHFENSILSPKASSKGTIVMGVCCPCGCPELVSGKSENEQLD